MRDMTLSEAIKKTRTELADAKNRVQELEHRINILSSLIEEIEPTETPISRRTRFPTSQDLRIIDDRGERERLGEAITRYIESATGEFSAATIANELQVKFPEIDMRRISRRASQYVFNYHNEGKLDRIKEGSGNVPTIYRLKR